MVSERGPFHTSSNSRMELIMSVKHATILCHVIINFFLCTVVVETGEEFAEAVERDSRAPRGSRPIFECYWNGRLIPYTSIDV